MLTKSDITILMQQVDVTKAYHLLAMFKEAGKERIDIRTILDEAAPKIFFRYYYVNSSTGEKSGTMLAECKWTAAAQQNADPGEGD